MTFIRRRKAPKRRFEESRDMLIPKQGNLRFPVQLKWVRGHECIINNNDCRGPIHAAHYDGPIPNEDRGGKSVKDHDKWTFPLCEHHHINEYHVLGWNRFDRKYRVDTKQVALQTAMRSPHKHLWEMAR